MLKELTGYLRCGMTIFRTIMEPMAISKKCLENVELEKKIVGTSLAIQWLRLSTSTAWGTRSIPYWGN